MSDRLGKYAVRTMVFAYLSVAILLPVAAIVREGFRSGAPAFLRAISSPDALGALGLTLRTASIMAAINAIMGTWIAYVLVRVSFPGRAWVNAIIDLPFAIPTLVTGVMIVLLFGPTSVIGAWFNAHHVRLMFAEPGIVIALLFVTLPFVVRAVQPVLHEIDATQEEAAITLGASPWLAFRKVVLPALVPAIRTGTLLSFSRALGEFGSIVIVSGNIPRRTLTTAVLVYGEIESGRAESAAAISTLLLLIALGLLLLVDLFQRSDRYALP